MKKPRPKKIFCNLFSHGPFSFVTGFLQARRMVYCYLLQLIAARQYMFINVY